MLAGTAGAIIIGFNVRPSTAVQTMADRENIQIRTYRVIYDVIDDVENAMKGMLDPVFEEKIIGHAEVRQIFKASQIGNSKMMLRKLLPAMNAVSALKHTMTSKKVTLSSASTWLKLNVNNHYERKTYGKRIQTGSSRRRNP